MRQPLDVCLCTHNPRRDLLARVLEALAQQSLTKTKSAFHVWVVDNGSTPPLGPAEMAPLKEAGVSFTLLQEPRLGLVFARITAIEASQSEWMVFVDDDALLAPDYLERALEIAWANPRLGCFGGKLLLPPSLQPPKWALPLLPYLAIKDCGDKPITVCANEWGVWEPPGAGSVVRRPVLELYVKRLQENPVLGRLGRRGNQGLFSCEDSLMMRGAAALGLACSYQPSLRLEHYLSPSRFRFRYLARLLYYMGRSHIILESALGQPLPPAPVKEGWRLLRKIPFGRVKICRRAYQWGRFLESRAQLQDQTPELELSTSA